MSEPEESFDISSKPRRSPTSTAKHLYRIKYRQVDPDTLDEAATAA